MMAALIIAFAALVLLIRITTLVLPPALSAALWIAASLLGSVMSSEAKNILLAFDRYLQRRRPFSQFATKLSRSFPFKNYVDLIAVMLPVLMLSALVFNAFQFALEEMIRSGFVAFPKGDDGFVHLQLYVCGFVTLPPLLIALGAYGFRRGFVGQTTSFGGLFGAMIFAFVLVGVLFQVARREVTSIENYKLLAKANPNALPVSIPLAITAAVGTVLVGFLLITVFVWLAVKAGELLRLGYDKLLKLPDNNFSPAS
jgi:hypothetical protein